MCFWGFYIDFIPINKESREKLRFIDLIAIIQESRLNRRFPKIADFGKIKIVDFFESAISEK